MDLVTIDGTNYDVCVLSIEENFKILDSENSGRSIAEKGRMIREIVGTFLGHKVTFRRRGSNLAAFDNLFEVLRRAQEYHSVKIVHNQTTITYDAYVTTGVRKVERVEGSKVLWGELEVEFVPMEAR